MMEVRSPLNGRLLGMCDDSVRRGNAPQGYVAPPPQIARLDVRMSEVAGPLYRISFVRHFWRTPAGLMFLSWIVVPEEERVAEWLPGFLLAPGEQTVLEVTPG